MRGHGLYRQQLQKCLAVDPSDRNYVCNRMKNHRGGHSYVPKASALMTGLSDG